LSDLARAIPEKNNKCIPIIGSQSMGDPPTSIRRGSPKTAPPKPRPVLTKPIHTKMSEINNISNEVNTIITMLPYGV
jgi:hypothetical protein